MTKLPRRMALALVPLALFGCGDDAPVTRDFEPLRYDYLNPIRLNVASIEIDDRSSVAGSADVQNQAPVPPAQALRQMAQDRLVAGGASGRALFIIDQTSILRGEGGFDGTLGVELEIHTPDGARVAFAEARVARRRVPGDGEGRQAALYALTRQMMDDMNVEFEFQVRRTLKEWLQGPPGAAAPVERQDLRAPGT